MKRLSFLLATLLLLTFSCNKDTKPPNDTYNISNESLIKIYSNIGDLHNQVLEIVYNGLKNGSIHNHGGYKAAIASYLQNPVGSGNNSVGLTLNTQIFLAKLESLYKAGRIDEYANLQREYLAKSELTMTERKSVIGCISVLRASALYWTPDNVKKWKELTSHVTLSDGGKDIVFADAKGAAKGAVTGAITGAAGGTMTIPGIGTIAGAAGVGLAGMVFGAASASIDHVITGWVKRWIGWSQAPSCVDGYIIQGQQVIICTFEDSLKWVSEHPVDNPFDSL